MPRLHHVIVLILSRLYKEGILSGAKKQLFIDPEPSQLRAAVAAGAPAVELHTGRYADAESDEERGAELARLREAVELGVGLGLQVNAGHGLSYENVEPVAAIPGIEEFNIGHAIVARALFTGLASAVSEMKRLIRGQRP